MMRTGRGVAMAGLGALLIGALVAPASAVEIDETLLPVLDDTNEANLDLDINGNPNSPFPATSQVRPSSRMAARYDTVTKVLTLDSATLVGTDVVFDVNGLFIDTVEAVNIQVVQIEEGDPPMVGIDDDGSFLAKAVVPVYFQALVRRDDDAFVPFSQEVQIFLEGTLTLSGAESGIRLTDLTADIPPLDFTVNGADFTVSGDITLNFAAGIFADNFEDGTTEAWADQQP